MSKQVERRFHAQEFRVSGEGEPAKIGGYALVFNSLSEDLGWGLTEEIDPHALDGVLGANPDVRALFNHDPSLILGRTTAGTLRLSVDARGLAYEVDPPDTQVARDLIVSMRRKDVTQSSFGFIVADDQWTENADGTVTRRILEIAELLDVSPVTFPAYPAATSGIRSLPPTMPAEMRSRFAKRDGGSDIIGDLVNDQILSCGCDCDPCTAGNCSGCDDLDCDDPSCENCGAVSMRSRESMQMQLRVAQARMK